MNRINRKLLGLVGQAAAFGAMILPIIHERFESLAFLIIVSAITNLTVILASMASGHLIPSQKSQRRVEIAIQGTFIFILIINILFLSVWLISNELSLGSNQNIILYAALFTTAQALYLIAMSLIVRARLVNEIYLLRLRYGVVLIILTEMALLFSGSGEYLVLAYVMSTLYAAFLTRNENNKYFALTLAHQITKLSFKNHLLAFRYFLDNAPVIVATLISTGAFHVTTLSVGNSGPFQSVWAVILRIVGGFGSTSSQLIAPQYEGIFSEKIRNKKYIDAIDSLSLSLKIGVMVGLFTSIFASMGVFWVFNLSEHERIEYFIFICIGLMISLSIGVGSMIAKFPGLSGVGYGFLKISIFKIVLASLSLIFLDKLYLIIALVAIEFLYQILILLSVRSRLRGLSNECYK